jgi:hypothetical protein
MEYYWWNVTDKGKPVVLGEIPVPIPLPPWIPRVLSWDQTGASSFLILFTFAAALPADLKYFIYFTGPHVAQAVLMCMRKLLGTFVLTGIFSCIHFYSSPSYFWFLTSSFTFLRLYAFSVWICAELPFCSVMLIPPIQQMCQYIQSVFIPLLPDSADVSVRTSQLHYYKKKMCHYTSRLHLV